MGFEDPSDTFLFVDFRQLVDRDFDDVMRATCSVREGEPAEKQCR